MYYSENFWKRLKCKYNNRTYSIIKEVFMKQPVEYNDLKYIGQKFDLDIFDNLSYFYLNQHLIYGKIYQLITEGKI